MARGRNYTAAERALQLICAKAGLSYKGFCELMAQSQGKEPRVSPESSYNMVQGKYLTDLDIKPEDWDKMLSHVRGPRNGYGSGNV